MDRLVAFQAEIFASNRCAEVRGGQRMRILPLIAGIVLFSAVTASATSFTYQANLNGASESPPTGSPGTGIALVTFDDVADTLRVTVNFSGLTAGTTAAHIHCCTTSIGTGNVGVATQTPTFAGFPLGVTSGAYDQFFDTTLTSTYNSAFVTAQGGTALSAEAALATGLAADQAYFNIHTTAFPGGEIRGFLQPVPEPSTMALIAAGLAGPVLLRRRRAMGAQL